MKICFPPNVLFYFCVYLREVFFDAIDAVDAVVAVVAVVV